MDKGFMVLNPSEMSAEEFKRLILFLEKLTAEEKKKAPEGV